ncbi:MAG: CDP-alcohol phosphatidyltransferase family protein [Acidobacteriota bacterium]
MHKHHIPWLMATARALLGPIVALGHAARWDGSALAALVVAALFSDIFDGILARRWHSDTAALRLFDSMADTVFYIGVATAIAIAHPHLWRTHALLFFPLITLEALRFAFDFTKFGKPSSYHSYLAKTWGLLLAISVVTLFARSHADNLIAAALALGILCDIEGLTMSLLLPEWRRDVKSLSTAVRLRRSSLASHPAPAPLSNLAEPV